ncbi:hypothetical protein ACS0TY_013029 [Phlomoides rotata]
METLSIKESSKEYDRIKELKAFEETKASVKGLVDSGIQNVPKIFIRPHDELLDELNYSHSDLQVPIIDLSGIGGEDYRRKIVGEVK